jgi:hypothetical protein
MALSGEMDHAIGSVLVEHASDEVSVSNVSVGESETRVILNRFERRETAAIREGIEPDNSEI